MRFASQNKDEDLDQKQTYKGERMVTWKQEEHHVLESWSSSIGKNLLHKMKTKYVGLGKM